MKKRSERKLPLQAKSSSALVTCFLQQLSIAFDPSCLLLSFFKIAIYSENQKLTQICWTHIQPKDPHSKHGYKKRPGTHEMIYQSFLATLVALDFTLVSSGYGKDGISKTDEFSEKFQTAFDPPPLIFGKSCCAFRDKIATKVRMFSMAGLLCII